MTFVMQSHDFSYLQPSLVKAYNHIQAFEYGL